VLGRTPAASQLLFESSWDAHQDRPGTPARPRQRFDPSRFERPSRRPQPWWPSSYIGKADGQTRLPIFLPLVDSICARHGSPLGACALQFPLGHPSVAAVVFGARSRNELECNLGWFRTPLPEALWDEAIKAHLLLREVRIPTQGSFPSNRLRRLKRRELCPHEWG
jgi:hypothetical protein